MRSLNFEFLKSHEPMLLKLGKAAERYCFEDPNVSLYKLRQFGEVLAQVVARRLRVEVPNDQVGLLRSLCERGVIRGDVDRLFHEIRKTGNSAVHHFGGNQRVALECLEYAYLLAGWFHRAFGGDKTFKLPPFIAPQFQDPTTPSLETTRLKQEVDRLNQKLAESLSIAELAETDRLRQAQQLVDLQQSALDAATEKQQIEQRLLELEALSQDSTPQTLQKIVNRAIDTTIDLDESATRRLVDRQLQAAGWRADSQVLTHSSGARPEKNVNQAIAEVPIGKGRADYVLFIGLEAVGIIEAKRKRKSVQEVGLRQAMRYAMDFPGGKLPFVFATNGKPFQQQLKSMSGIWFQDLRSPTNGSRPMGSWFGPDDLKEMLKRDRLAADAKLGALEFAGSLQLYDYQQQAVLAVENAIALQRREILLAMATGTGKTRTAIALCYRLLKADRFRRILFLVDRSILGDQTELSFGEVNVSPTLRFSDVFDVMGLKNIVPDIDTRVQIATVQGLVKRVLYNSDNRNISPGQYDCIIVDECHRGYTIDREMSDSELEFRDLNDYLSKYRQVLDYFDAVKIGLTATPALHTSQIFGAPVFYYTYNQAVMDGKLVPHEPAVEIHTKLSDEKVIWAKDAEIETLNPINNQIDILQAPDEITVSVEQFNRRVMVPEFNRVVCEELCDRLDPSGQGKTLIFCVTDVHADEVVALLREGLRDRYGEIHGDLVAKITGAADQPKEWTKRFKNEQYPNIVVTVDLLTTGVDVPKITNLVFLRRVNSRILYEQMLGRATRLCQDIGKEAFTIYDAVGVCRVMEQHTDMTPTVVTPKTNFNQLVQQVTNTDLTHGKPNAIANVSQAIDQLLSKLQRQSATWSEERSASFESLAGVAIESIVPFVRSQSQVELQQWLRSRPELVEFLDRRESTSRNLWIANHADELRRVDRFYGAAEAGKNYKAADYLEQFQQDKNC
jgi:type I restriction enzyme, R subunit